MELVIGSASGLRGTYLPRGDKSISHRGLIFGAMASGSSKVIGCSSGGDVASTASCLEQLGIALRPNEGTVEVEGTGWKVADAARLDTANSGTTMRLLTGALSGRRGEFVLEGDESLSKRPMDRIAQPLRSMGAKIELEHDKFPPIQLKGGPLKGIDFVMSVASAQVKGAVILGALQAEGVTRIDEPNPARDHTERLLSWLGVPLVTSDRRIEVRANEPLLPLPNFELQVPGDFSSAAFLITAACLAPGSDLTITDVGLNPLRTGMLEVLNEMGATIETELESREPEPMGRIRVRTAQLTATSVSGELIPRTLDELSLVALAATQAEGTTVVKDAEELRVKEADRITVLAAGLRTLGAEVEEFSDGFAVTGPRKLTGGLVDPAGDHRMALTFAVAGLIASAPVTILGWECSKISFPEFEEDLAKLRSA